MLDSGLFILFFSPNNNRRKLKMGLKVVCSSLLGAMNSQGQVLGTVIPDGEGQFFYSYEIQNSTVFDSFRLSLNLSFDESLEDWDPLDVDRTCFQSKTSSNHEK